MFHHGRVEELVTNQSNSRLWKCTYPQIPEEGERSNLHWHPTEPGVKTKVKTQIYFPMIIIVVITIVGTNMAVHRGSNRIQIL